VEKGRLVSGPLYIFRVGFTWMDQGLYSHVPEQQIIQGIAYSEKKNTRAMTILVSSLLYILALILSLGSQHFVTFLVWKSHQHHLTRASAGFSTWDRVILVIRTNCGTRGWRAALRKEIWGFGGMES